MVLAAKPVSAIMKKLHKEHLNTDHFEPKEGQRRSLCSNNTGMRCPSLGNYPNPNEMSEDVALDYIARILVDIFISKKRHEWNTK